MPESKIEWKPDDEGVLREHRYEVVATVDCSRCGSTVELEADTEGWVMDDEGRWTHESFGPGQGTCCGLLYADWFDGTHVFVLGNPVEPESEADRG